MVALTNVQSAADTAPAKESRAKAAVVIIVFRFTMVSFNRVNCGFRATVAKAVA